MSACCAAASPTVSRRAPGRWTCTAASAPCCASEIRFNGRACPTACSTTTAPVPPSAATGVPLAPLTTLRLGGPAARVVEARSDDELVCAVRAWDAGRGLVLLLAGGSNVVIADTGFAGEVVRVHTRGIERHGTTLRVTAG